MLGGILELSNSLCEILKPEMISSAGWKPRRGVCGAVRGS